MDATHPPVYGLPIGTLEPHVRQHRRQGRLRPGGGHQAQSSYRREVSRQTITSASVVTVPTDAGITM